MTDYIILDMLNLFRRLFHGAHGAGSWLDRVGAALYGFPPTLDRLAVRFGSRDFVFSFDAPVYKRTALLPGYKSGGENAPDGDERAEAVVVLKRAVKRLGESVLNDMGWTNIYARAGYEADDVMAAVRDGLTFDDRCVLITGDKDVYQLLDHRCAAYDPQRDKFVTANTFRAEFGIEPRQWVDVKALGGCDGDKIPGCPGVQEKTALRYVRGELPTHHRVYADIQEFTRCGGITQNAQLVELPFPGLGPITPAPQVVPDDTAWKRYYSAFGLPTPADARRDARGVGN